MLVPLAHASEQELAFTHVDVYVVTLVARDDMEFRALGVRRDPRLTAAVGRGFYTYHDSLSLNIVR